MIAILSALARGTLTPADVSRLPGAPAVLAALVLARGGRGARGLSVREACAALREAGHVSEAEALPEAMVRGGKRGEAVRAVEDARARLAREAEDEDEQGEDGEGEAGDGERGPGYGAAIVGGDPAGGAGMGAGRDPIGHREPADAGVAPGVGGDLGRADRGDVCGPRPLERPAAARAPESWEAGRGELLGLLTALPALYQAAGRSRITGYPGRPCYPAGPCPGGTWWRTWRG